MWKIDGSQKSGSGTIVRGALSLAAVMRQELEVANIRTRRDPPGLRAQHLTAAVAIAELVGGQLEGAEIGSLNLRFVPRDSPHSGSFGWDIGTAGSTSMLAAALLPLAAASKSASSLRLIGGVFQDHAPTGFHTQMCLLNHLKRMGLSAELEVVRPGYYPKGNGIVDLIVKPVSKWLFPLKAADRSENVNITGIALSSHLERQQVSERMAAACEEQLLRRGFQSEFQVIYENTAPQPGAALAVFAADSNGNILGADCAGARGRPSEEIGKKVARILLEDLSSGATVDRFVSDQLILFAGLANGESEFRIPGMTDHIEASLWLLETLIGVRHQLDGNCLRITGMGFDFSGS